MIYVKQVGNRYAFFSDDGKVIFCKSHWAAKRHAKRHGYTGYVVRLLGRIEMEEETEDA